ncbi:MAG: caspase family protein [Stenomitos rutilans HA7619-LM2]|jgi:hypothetical protein|nr:caspase family protein [Stenomitos rutilans HA7619-LM2]
MTQTATFTHGYALLIGVGQSAWTDWSLPVTVKDVKALQAILVDPALCGYPETNIRTLTDSNATRQGILDGLQWLQQQAASDPQATVVAYYSGHGWLDQTQNRYYLVQHDIKPFNLPGSALAATEFTEALQQIPAARLLVMIDSCHAEGMATSKEAGLALELPTGFVALAPSKGLFDPLTQRKGRAVFTSCAGTQKSWIRQDQTMSIFTDHLIEALRGAANKAGETTVKVSHLMNHLGETVPASARAEWQADQDPQCDFKTEDFEIALLQGGKGLPEGGWDAVKAPPAAAGSRVTTAAGERSIAVGGDVSGSSFVTGDGNVVGRGNVVQRGKYNLNAGSIRGLRVGDTYGSGTPEAFGEEESEEEQTRTAKGFEPLPGQAQPLAATKYVCPEPDCDIAWVRRSVGQAIPQCSIHQVALVPVHRS